MVVKEDKNEVMDKTVGGCPLVDKKHRLKHRFEVVKKLGQGTYGKVQLAINKETSQEVAIKTIKKSKIESEQDLVRIRREIQIMSSVQHPNIIHIYEVFENKDKIVLVMQYASGGELYDYLSQKRVLNDLEARRVFRQIAAAIYYCHKNKICHRDLKLENVLLDERGNAKIADFGLSNVFDHRHLLATYCGSPLYASPEIVKGTPYYGPEVDCWSLGVLLYTLVYGAMPFDGSNFKRLVRQISEGDYYEPKKKSDATHLIRHLLTVSPAKRACIADICSNPWVNFGYEHSLLQVAEDTANLTPVRIDLLLALAPVSPTSMAPAPFPPKAKMAPSPSNTSNTDTSGLEDDHCQETATNSFAFISGGMENASKENPDDIFQDANEQISDEYEEEDEFLSADAAAELEGDMPPGIMKRPAEKSFEGSMVRVSSMAHKSKKPRKSQSQQKSPSQLSGSSQLKQPVPAVNQAKTNDSSIEERLERMVQKALMKEEETRRKEASSRVDISSNDTTVVPDLVSTTQERSPEVKEAKVCSLPMNLNSKKEKDSGAVIVELENGKDMIEGKTIKTDEKDSQDNTLLDKMIKEKAGTLTVDKILSPSSEKIVSVSTGNQKTESVPEQTETTPAPKKIIKKKSSVTKKAAEKKETEKKEASPTVKNTSTVVKEAKKSPEKDSVLDSKFELNKSESDANKVTRRTSSVGKSLVRKRSEASPDMAGLTQKLLEKPALVAASVKRPPGKLVMPRFLESSPSSSTPKSAGPEPKKLVLPIKSVSDAKRAFETKGKIETTESLSSLKRKDSCKRSQSPKKSLSKETTPQLAEEKVACIAEVKEQTIMGEKEETITKKSIQEESTGKNLEKILSPSKPIEKEMVVKNIEKPIEKVETVVKVVQESLSGEVVLPLVAKSQVSVEKPLNQEAEKTVEPVPDFDDKKSAAKSILKKTIARAKLADKKMSQQSSFDSESGSPSCGTPSSTTDAPPSFYKKPRPYSRTSSATTHKEVKSEVPLRETIWGSPLSPSDGESKLKKGAMSSSIDSDLNNWRQEVEESLKRLSPEGAANETSERVSYNTQNSLDSSGPMPITRSYKKFTFTKDGSCITETGEVYTEPAPDGTWTKVEKTTKVTTQPQKIKELPIKEDLDSLRSFKSREEPSPLRHSDSQSSSGSNDVFDDIFDSWTGDKGVFGSFVNSAFDRFKNNSLLRRHERKRSSLRKPKSGTLANEVETERQRRPYASRGHSTDRESSDNEDDFDFHFEGGHPVSTGPHGLRHIMRSMNQDLQHRLKAFKDRNSSRSLSQDRGEPRNVYGRSTSRDRDRMAPRETVLRFLIDPMKRQTSVRSDLSSDQYPRTRDKSFDGYASDHAQSYTSPLDSPEPVIDRGSYYERRQPSRAQERETIDPPPTQEALNRRRRIEHWLDTNPEEAPGDDIYSRTNRSLLNNMPELSDIFIRPHSYRMSKNPMSRFGSSGLSRSTMNLEEPMVRPDVSIHPRRPVFRTVSEMQMCEEPSTPDSTGEEERNRSFVAADKPPRQQNRYATYTRSSSANHPEMPSDLPERQQPFLRMQVSFGSQSPEARDVWPSSGSLWSNERGDSTSSLLEALKNKGYRNVMSQRMYQEPDMSSKKPEESGLEEEKSPPQPTVTATKEQEGEAQSPFEQRPTPVGEQSECTPSSEIKYQLADTGSSSLDPSSPQRGKAPSSYLSFLSQQACLDACSMDTNLGQRPYPNQSETGHFVPIEDNWLPEKGRNEDSTYSYSDAEGEKTKIPEEYSLNTSPSDGRPKVPGIDQDLLNGGCSSHKPCTPLVEDIDLNRSPKNSSYERNGFHRSDLHDSGEEPIKDRKSSRRRRTYGLNGEENYLDGRITPDSLDSTRHLREPSPGYREESVSERILRKSFYSRFNEDKPVKRRTPSYYNRDDQNNFFQELRGGLWSRYSSEQELDHQSKPKATSRRSNTSYLTNSEKRSSANLEDLLGYKSHPIAKEKRSSANLDDLLDNSFLGTCKSESKSSSLYDDHGSDDGLWTKKPPLPKGKHSTSSSGDWYDSKAGTLWNQRRESRTQPSVIDTVPDLTDNRRPSAFRFYTANSAPRSPVLNTKTTLEDDTSSRSPLLNESTGTLIRENNNNTLGTVE